MCSCWNNHKEDKECDCLCHKEPVMTNPIKEKLGRSVLQVLTNLCHPAQPDYAECEHCGFYVEDIMKLIASALEEREVAIDELNKSNAAKAELIKHYERDKIPLLEATLKEKEERVAMLESRIKAWEDHHESLLSSKEAEIKALKFELNEANNYALNMSARASKTEELHKEAEIEKLKKVIEERGYAFQDAQTKCLLELSSYKSVAGEMAEALLKASCDISSEYCSHISRSGPCGANVEGCYADYVYEALKRFKKLGGE